MLMTRESHDTEADGGDPRRVTVAVAIPLTAEQLGAVQAALGPGFTVEDVRLAPREAGVVVVPPCSPGTIQAVLRAFPVAQVLVVEIADDSEGGPVGRALSAGAAAYLRPLNPDGLAESVRWTQTGLAA
jgi:hypothetical protein